MGSWLDGAVMKVDAALEELFMDGPYILCDPEHNAALFVGEPFDAKPERIFLY